MDKLLSPEGDLLDAAMVVFEKHLDTHHCDECMNAYQVFIKAMTEWINRKVEQSQKEETHGSQESGEEKTEEQPQEDFLKVDEATIPDDDWELFK